MNIQDYPKWLGPEFAQSVSEVEFRIIETEKLEENAGISHITHECVPIMQIHHDAKERAGRVRYCQDFFVEIADKLEVLAMQLVPNVVIPENWAKRVREETGKYLDRVYKGDKEYLPYLCDDPTIVMKDKTKMVIVKLAVGIHNQHKRPTLFWMVLTEALAEKPDDPEMFTRACEIEKTYFE